jgi:hypothetical protein
MADEFGIYERQFMQNYADFLDSLVVKSTYDAEHAFGTSENIEEQARLDRLLKDSESSGELYTLAMFKRDTIFNYVVGDEVLHMLQIPHDLIALFSMDKAAFFRTIHGATLDSILTYYRKRTIATYKEQNPYYLALNGEPKNESEYAYIEDIFEGGSYPIHMYSETFHSEMYIHLTHDNYRELRIILAQLREQGKNYDYFDYLMRRTPYHIARNADNFDIIQDEPNRINTSDRTLFYESYREARLYVLEVPYVPSFAKTEVLYDRFMGVSILFLTTLRFLAKRMMNYLRNIYPTRWEKRLFLKQYNLDGLIDIIDDDIILNEIIDHIDEFIAVKGTDDVITRILALFGGYDIEVYKYLLFKTVKCDSITKEILVDPEKKRQDNYDISLIKVPINVISEARSLSSYISNKQNHVSLGSIAMSDKYFGPLTTRQADNLHDPKEEFVQQVENLLKNNEQFSMFYTKYVGVIAHVDAIKNMIQASYLFTTSIMADKETMDSHVNPLGFLEDVTVRDLFAAINYLNYARYNVSDEIITDPANIAMFFGFNPHPNLEELKAMGEYIIPTKDPTTGATDYFVKLPNLIKEDEIFVVKIPDQYQDIPPEYKRKNEMVSVYYYNLDNHDKLLDKMRNSTSYNEWLGFKQVFNYNMYSKTLLENYGNAETYAAYLSSRDNGLLDYIQNFLNSRTESVWYDDNGASTELFKLAISNLITRFLNLILSVIQSDASTNDAVLSTFMDSTAIFAKLMNVIELFKHYSVSFTSTETVSVVNNPRDCLVKIFDMIGKTEGSFNTQSVITLSLFDRLWSIGHSKLGTLTRIIDDISESSTGSGSSDINIQDKVSEVALYKEFNTLNLWDTIKTAGLEKFFLPIIINEEVIEDAKASVQEKITVDDKVMVSALYKEFNTLNLWDTIKQSSTNKLFDPVSVQHYIVSVMKYKLEDDIYISHNLKLMQVIGTIRDQIMIYSKLKSNEIKDVFTSIKIQDELICLEDA